MEKYEITKEAVLAMAAKCPEAKAVLLAGFPQAFAGEWVDVTRQMTVEPGQMPRGKYGHSQQALFLVDGNVALGVKSFCLFIDKVSPSAESEAIAHGFEYKMEGAKILRRKK